MASFGEICSNSYFKLGEKLLKTMHLPNILWRQKTEVKFFSKLDTISEHRVSATWEVNFLKFLANRNFQKNN